MTDLEVKLREALRLHKELELRKALYNELDVLIEALQAAGFTEMDLDEFHIKLTDNFADTNTQWRMAAVKRWELKIAKRKD